MHPHVFLLLLSSGVSSYFLSQKKMPHLLNETKYSLIGEMLCLLQAENEHINEKLDIPLHIEKPACAHSNTEIFIHGLNKIATRTCMKKVEKDMEELENTCNILKKSSSNHKSCSKATTGFPEFKKSLQKFLRWVNEQDCSSIGRGESGLYLDGKCSCHDLWKSLGGLG